MRKGWTIGTLLAVAGSGLGLTVLAYTGWKHAYYWQTEVRIVLYAGLPALIGIVSAVSLFLRPGPRLMVLANGLAILAAAGAAEILLELGLVQPPPPPAASTSMATPVEPAYGAVCGYLFTKTANAPMAVPTIDGKPLLPVSGPSHAPHRWSQVGLGQGVFHLDDYGFANPPGQWQRPTDVVTVGDSYTFGLEVAPGNGFVDLLRPALGNTINLGCNGNGPLLELASLAEYGPVLRPKLVLWFYYEGNDLLVNLPAELDQPVLRRYLDGDAQGLYARNAEKDAVWRQVLPPPSAAGGSGMAAAASAAQVQLRTLLTFGALRTAAGLQLDYDPAILAPLGSILSRAQSLTASWGGKVVFVYLPSEVRHMNRVAGWDADAYKRKVLTVVRQVGLPTIDVVPAFTAQANPRALYQGNHYSVRGYALAADVVREELARTGFGR